jgi:hypothetical protein
MEIHKLKHSARVMMMTGYSAGRQAWCLGGAGV